MHLFDRSPAIAAAFPLQSDAQPENTHHNKKKSLRTRREG